MLILMFWVSVSVCFVRSYRSGTNEASFYKRGRGTKDRKERRLNEKKLRGLGAHGISCSLNRNRAMLLVGPRAGAVITDEHGEIS